MGKKAVELYRCKNQHVTDAYDKAVFNICLQREKNGYKSFHLCGCEPGVGTTSVVMELAISLSSHPPIMESDFPLSEKSLKAMAVISILFPVRNPFLLELQYRCKNCFLRRIQIT